MYKTIENKNNADVTEESDFRFQIRYLKSHFLRDPVMFKRRFFYINSLLETIINFSYYILKKDLKFYQMHKV